MRVQLDNGRTSVDIDVENGSEKFLEVVVKALRVLNYSEVDILREFSTKEHTEEPPKAAPVVNTPNTLPPINGGAYVPPNNQNNGVK